LRISSSGTVKDVHNINLPTGHSETKKGGGELKLSFRIFFFSGYWQKQACQITLFQGNLKCICQPPAKYFLRAFFLGGGGGKGLLLVECPFHFPNAL